MPKQTIMIVEDDVSIRELIKKYLTKEGYNVIPIDRGEKALHYLNFVSPHLILLEIDMPDIDSFTVCQEIRKRSNVPIIFLSERRDMLDKLKCFELGGDDFITKPFKFEELLARIKANIRRYYTYPQEQKNILKYGKLEIHLHNYTCFLNGKLVNLSTKEIELLVHLAQRPNQVWSQEQLYDQIWGTEASGNLDTVRVHINYLRRKLEDDQTNPQYIKTMRGFGYYFSE